MKLYSIIFASLFLSLSTISCKSLRGSDCGLAKANKPSLKTEKATKTIVASNQKDVSTLLATK